MTYGLEGKSRNGKPLADFVYVVFLITIGLGVAIWLMSLPVDEREKLFASAFSLTIGVAALIMAQPGVYVVYKIGKSSLPLQRKIIWGLFAFFGIALVPLALMLTLLR